MRRSATLTPGNRSSRQLHEPVATNDRPASLMDHLAWLREVGFTSVDCTWRYLKFAVFGGWKPADDG
jgi:tRNA (cmo5U34)-methyltransferase